MIAAAALAGGFADPVFGSQAVFRATLDAMARPGRVVDLGSPVRPPPPLAAAAGAVLAALADDTSPVWLDGGLAATDVPAWIQFHTGAPVVPDPQDAAFAVVSDPAAMPAFAAFAQGSPEYPDRSATLVVQLEGLAGGERELVLEGPGIRDSVRIAPWPLPSGFAARMTANRGLFPRGLDLLLVAGSAVLGLPRSVAVTGDA